MKYVNIGVGRKVYRIYQCDISKMHIQHFNKRPRIPAFDFEDMKSISPALT